MTKKFIKKTKIIASVGPATWSEDKILELYQAWVNVIRINFSHAEYDQVRKVVARVNKLNTAWKTKLALLWDLKWPEIRLGDYEGKKTYHTWDIFHISIDESANLGELDQYCDYPYLLENMHEGYILKIESGIFDVEVLEVLEKSIKVKALNDAALSARRHVNLPGISIKLPGLIEQDLKDIEFCIQEWFNYIAMSFVRHANHVQELRAILNKHDASTIWIIAKIEDQEWLDNVEDIVKVSDGVMVARGDLGIEIPIAHIPVAQQTIINLCLKYGKISIVATQLIESMMETPFPTRAEVSDIFNAVSQQTDAVMTSGETAIGQYPIESIRMMQSIILEAERSISYHYKDYISLEKSPAEQKRKFLLKSALEMAENLDVSAVVIFTKNGGFARTAAAYRPASNIFAFTEDWTTFTNVALYFGVKSRYEKFTYHVDGLERALKWLITYKDIDQNDTVIVVSESKRGGAYHPSLEIINVAEFFDTIH